MTLKILYVDDEPDLREIAVMSLEMDPGFDVRECGSGCEALAEAASWQPDLILLDVMMPGLDGPETSEKLRADSCTAHIPFAFITAKAQPADIEALLEKGALAVISKPFDPTTLAQQARRLLRK
jgi:CheY-like chemotaxis protein